MARAHGPDGTVTNLEQYPVVYGGIMPETMCLIFMEIESSSAESCTFDPRKANAILRDHSDLTVNVEDHSLYHTNIDFHGGTVYPGDTYLTGVWFPIPELEWNNLGVITYEIAAPICASGESQEDPYEISVDTTEWIYEAIPESLMEVTND